MSSLMHLTGIHRWRGSRVSQSALGFFGVARGVARPLVKEYW
jgi:hypothetical protein